MNSQNHAHMFSVARLSGGLMLAYDDGTTWNQMIEYSLIGCPSIDIDSNDAFT